MGFPGANGQQQYATFVKGADRESGLIDILKKDDDIYFDLAANDFDRPFIVAPVLASGVGAEAFAGRIFPTFLIEFHRVGKRVLWIDKNSYFSAPPNSSAANALAISVTDSVINSTPIVAEDEKGGRVVVSGAFFLTDFENVGKDLSGGGGGGPALLLGLGARAGFSVDPSRSYIEKTKTLPENDEILSSLAFAGPAGERADRVLSHERNSGGIQSADSPGALGVERCLCQSRHSERGRSPRSTGRSELGSRRRALFDRPLDYERPAGVCRVRPEHFRSAHG
jgi:hypothetical protein